MQNKELEVLKEYFDFSLYEKLYPDVVSSGVDLWGHFIKYGIGEGRCFSRLASPSDVTEKYGHYNVQTITAYLMDIVEEKDDCSESEKTYMRNFGKGHSDCLSCKAILKHADVSFLNRIIAQYQPVDVIRFACERLNELQFNLNNELDVRAYLSMYPDVRMASANAFAHYYIAGRREGRNSKTPVSIGKAAEFLRLTNVAPKQDRNIILIEPNYLTARLKQLIGNSTIVTVSHDNPIESLGGIQQVILKEFDAFAESGYSSLHIFPQVPKAEFDESGDDDVVVGVVMNGEHIGSTPIGVLVSALANVKVVVKELRIHHLFGLNGYCLKLLFGINCPNKTYILHDHSFLCDGYHLLRNGLEYCGAPALNSTSCRFCTFGVSRQKRKGHLYDFVNAGFKLIAPSNSIANVANQFYPNLSNKLKVTPHWSFLPENIFKKAIVNKVNVAYCGFPAYHKGYDIFLDCFYSDRQKLELNFFLLGAHLPDDLPKEIRFVEVKSADLMAMSFKTELIRRNIHIVVLPSRCPESFGFIAHEALTAGCILLVPDKPAQPVTALAEDHRVVNCKLNEMAETLYTVAGNIKENGYTRKTMTAKFQLSYCNGE